MAYVHEFGIIDSIEKNKEYTYDPKKYNCISVDGDFIDEIYHKGFGCKMENIDTFINNTNSVYKNLAYYGTTLIPPTSLKELLEIISEENIKYESEELEKLVIKINSAIKDNKWMIHFGV